MSGTPAAKAVTLAGLVTCAVAAIPAAVRFAAAPSPRGLAWTVPLATFVIAFLIAVNDTQPAIRRRAAFAIEILAALSFTALARGGFGAAMTAVVAGQAPFFLRPWQGIALVGVQTAALAAIFARSSGAVEGLLGSGGYLGFQLFALGAAFLAVREATAREELARVNAELLATRELFADATRTAERLRIARDLHDAIGHHLTALGLHLEIARNVSDDKREAAVEQARTIAKQLLGEVREVVSELREDRPIDLARALDHLVAGVPRPKVHLAIDPSLRLAEPTLSHAIFRFVQEAITNAARHAGGQNLWIAIEHDGDSIRVSARDDGHGAAALREGNGLAGLRERVEELGGSLEIDAERGRGVALRAIVPLREGAT